jgi:tRNA nucleotidyltransferase (CCA-adding enzyme)
MMPIFNSAVPVLKKIEDAGFEAYFVGGSVRDFVLGKGVADVDIATSATPQEIKQIFPKTVDVGIEHGTVVVIWGKDTYEVTTFRTESEYIDFRRPAEVTFIRSLEEDLKRRDFTMNSIAMDKEGRLIDPFKGREAIQNKIIETVGSASERFHEDALRMMRAVRFVSQLSFAIERNTYQALSKNAPLLAKIAVERKTAEFEKLLQGESRAQALEALIDTGLYQYLPGLQGQKAQLIKLLPFAQASLSLLEMWTLLLFVLEIKLDEAESFLKQWKLPVKKIKAVKGVLSWLRFRCQSPWSVESVYEAKLEQAIHAEILYNTVNNQPLDQSIEELKQQYETLLIKDRQELRVSGNDLMEWESRRGGRWLKEKLFMIEKAVLRGEVQNEKEAIREWLYKCNQN